MSFQIRFWGTRGSIPTPGPRTVRYGGNTPCVELRTSAGELIVLDAGTGIRELGRSLLARANGAPIRADLFVTHAHWDHVQGLPFFEPVFRDGHHVTIWLAPPPHDALEAVVREQMAPSVFPVSFESLMASVDFRSLDAVWPERTYSVETMQVRHPGGALALRFRELDDPSSSFVYVSDNELQPDDADGAYSRLVSFARGARVLVHDAMYTESEYERHRGWGHSTDQTAVRLALDAGVATLVLFHHAPSRTDDEVDQMVERCRREASGRLEVVAAAEGMELRC